MRWEAQKQANTEWVVAELEAYWEEGKKTGLLSTKRCHDQNKVKSIMREKGVDVLFRFECRPMDIDSIHDKTYFIMSRRPSEVSTIT